MGRGKHILDTTEDCCGLPRGTVERKSRRKSIVKARHLAWLIIRERCSKSIVQIAQTSGGYDHTSVLYGIQKARQNVESGKWREIYDLIIDVLDGKRPSPAPAEAVEAVRPRARWTRDMLARLAEYLAEYGERGEDFGAIAHALDVSEDDVRYAIAKRGIKWTRPTPRFSPEICAEAAEMRKYRYSLQEAADDLGISAEDLKLWAEAEFGSWRDKRGGAGG